jgi:transaldolase
MPEGTLNEVRAHGVVRGDTITSEFKSAAQTFVELKAAGIDMAKVTQHLEDDGVAKFIAAWDELLHNVDAAIVRMTSSEGSK